MRNDGTLNVVVRPSGISVTVRTWDGVDRPDYSERLSEMSAAEVRHLIAELSKALVDQEQSERLAAEAQRQALLVERERLQAKLSHLDERLAAA